MSTALAQFSELAVRQMTVVEILNVEISMQFFRTPSLDWTGISLKVRRMGKRFANWKTNCI